MDTRVVPCTPAGVKEILVDAQRQMMTTTALLEECEARLAALEQLRGMDYV